MIEEPTPWKYLDNDKKVVARTWPDGRVESCLATREDVQAWIAQGHEPDPAD